MIELDKIYKISENKTDVLKGEIKVKKIDGSLDAIRSKCRVVELWTWSHSGRYISKI